ncbi:MAG: 16S rRNA (guanine(527)-N(7))-methyltransferase RsmG [Clostridia bacterium]|nr:16S rRNA (guanine(527)-N(7))-methyltransferase RsmG [Clostridia bacterium]MBQ8792504.1 16S rRNA (guanine(527)-N(7))-methyltransferase RsmG [Clostridia bacterium]
MRELIKNTFEKYGLALSDLQIGQFEKYYNYLIEENEKFNLTAITQPDEVARKHFVDSVLPFEQIPQNSSVIDVGTGAGFPGVPLKILRPDIKLTLLDSLNKRVEFLKRLASLLQLKDITFVHSRAEDYVKETREKFDIALSRAVAGLPTLSEYLLPYVKKGGKVLMYKGAKAEEELAAGESAIKTLGGKVKEIKEYFLSEEDGTRKIVVVEKVTKTPLQYPRGKNLPKTKPIQ